jgi:glycosyltransferase involved in cell wall biosynthesis
MEENLKELVNSLERAKISIVMQSYLGDYPGSRTDALAKFRRAVKSFENQIYKNCELIIVADGCVKTNQIYNREFKQNPNIKLVFLDRDKEEDPTGNSIEYKGAEYKIWRGAAKSLGVAAASGKLITYMDSDDYLLPEFTQTLLFIYNSSKEKQWWLNKSWYTNQADKSQAGDLFRVNMESEPAINIENIRSLWKEVKLTNGSMPEKSWLFMHVAEGPIVKWRDTFGNLSQDSDYIKRFRSLYPKGSIFEKPIYVKCHSANNWDI